MIASSPTESLCLCRPYETNASTERVPFYNLLPV
jgi:hypothetical protein